VCCAGSRLFIEEAVKEQFLERLQEKSRKINVGNPLDKATQMGPQVSLEQLDRIKGYVDIGQKEGAAVLCGGVSPDLSDEFKNGYFFQPTILSDVSNQMRVAQEEIFGPVVSVIGFEDEEELIKQANATVLACRRIWTKDITRAHRFAKAVRPA
jgi:acyl-CoA reductase-like NAD-dependent aldehyde dehydrogenase